MISSRPIAPPRFARRARLALAATLCAWTLAPTAAIACPMCKGSLSPEEELKQAAAAIALKVERHEATKAEASAMLATAEVASKRRVGTTKGFAYSIYFMLLVPSGIFAILAIAVVKTARDNIRGAQAAQAEAEAAGAIGEAVAQG
jgi:hypothetical protein